LIVYNSQTLLVSRLSATAPPLLFLCRGWGPSGHAVRTSPRWDGGEGRCAAAPPSPPVSTTQRLSSENTARRGQGKAVGFMARRLCCFENIRRDYSQCAAYASTDQGGGSGGWLAWPENVPETTTGRSKCCRWHRLRVSCSERRIIVRHPLAPASCTCWGHFF
jgi:hypothetical protein